MNSFLSIFSENIGSIIILLALVAIVTLVVIGVVRNKKRGRTSCGNSCSGCPMSGKCHSYTKDKDVKK